MNIRTEFTNLECDNFRRDCNFTPEELVIFNLRVQDVSLVAILERLKELDMHMSPRTLDRRLQSIKKKIIKVC